MATTLFRAVTLSDQAEQVEAPLAGWLAPKGLVFNEDKTNNVHLNTGCGFLGSKTHGFYGRLLIRLSKESFSVSRNGSAQ